MNENGSANGSTPETMIRLENLTKVFPGQEQAAVDDLSMEIPKGEIVVFVGPSGCGKTTTMKMINRVIEPSSGRIFLEGEDVTKVNADKLRRRMGYVIQQIGLFPHLTIADNIATVPKMLGWDKKRISERTDELLETVGMDVSYRDRYPKELSGGQRQRVGVARAMAADPPVLLMDEPFGAIDPITRDRLQNEFLRLQQEIKKTIIFVTHDIDEAIKMGDRIAILRTQSRIAQYDTPERILTDPADEFVEDFIGSGASIKRLSLSRVRDIKTADWPVATFSEGRDAVHQLLGDSGKDHVLLLDNRRRPKRWVSRDDLAHGGSLEEAGWPAVAIVEKESSLYNVLDTMITSYKGSAIVVNDEGRYEGIVDFEAVLEAINTMRPTEQEQPVSPEVSGGATGQGS
ncbi:MAG: ABC transporter, ATP-binding protein (cluster 13, osmolytes) [uncultured Rubrobacteraceae bacterium]|uniref:ABC-type quaternary amine transporter n=1 Tax=uncultured Rubrobacteraceae bacterium TaxID=349277 RepID=A0A6J4PY41_9ACTN|nr:MAG: ABC transporter, ATP-binding protein (cluster 13, osmolytes) [uncultured Rubrobacteraceae bacterium]